MKAPTRSRESWLRFRIASRRGSRFPALGFRHFTTNKTREQTGDNAGNKAGDGGDAININQVAMYAGDRADNSPNPRAEQDPAGHDRDNTHVDQRSSTGTPDQVLKRAKSEKIAVTASNSLGVCADLCRSSRNRRRRMRKRDKSALMPRGQNRQQHSKYFVHVCAVLIARKQHDRKPRGRRPAEGMNRKSLTNKRGLITNTRDSIASTDEQEFK